MMRITRLALATVALVLMIAPSAWADVIPSRPQNKADAGSVQSRLVDVGMSPDKAADFTAAAPAEELAFFAKDPQSIQVVGSLWLEEWVFGLAMVGTLGGYTYYRMSK